MNLPEKIEAVVRAWPQWSRAERRNLQPIIDEIISHCADGTGNPFIQRWCELNLSHLFQEAK